MVPSIATVDASIAAAAGRGRGAVTAARGRSPSPVARSSPRQWDSPERTPPRSTSLPPPLPSLVDGRAANAAFPSLFGLQFRRLLWRRRAGPEDLGLQLGSLGLPQCKAQ